MFNGVLVTEPMTKKKNDNRSKIIQGQYRAIAVNTATATAKFKASK